MIASADATARAVLADAVAALLGQPHVVLADDALTRTDLLLVERTQRGDGRSTERPVAFRLVKEGDACVLVRQPDGPKRRLDGVPCRPAP